MKSTSPPTKMKKRKAMIENSTIEAPRALRGKDRKRMNMGSVANHAFLMEGVDAQRRPNAEHRKEAEPGIGGAGRNPHDSNRIGSAIGASAGVRINWVGDSAESHRDVADIPPRHALRAAADLAVGRKLLGRDFVSDRIIEPRQIPGRVTHSGCDHVIAVKSTAKLEGPETKKDEKRQHNRKLDQRGTLSLGAKPLHSQERLLNHGSPPAH